MNVLLLSHCDFSGNSGMHVFAVANELAALGFSPVVGVPHGPETVELIGMAPRFTLCTYAQLRAEGAAFPDGRGPDLVHAWTPREHVRRAALELAARHRCGYLVHQEDNEAKILEDDLGRPMEELLALSPALLDAIVPEHRTHPRRGRAFLAGAAGVTALMDRLLDDAPAGGPGLVFWPGFDERFRELPAPSAALRAKACLAPGERAIVYTGDVHASNVGEVRSLLLAVAALRRRGAKLKLVKTGWNRLGTDWTEGLGTTEVMADLGFLRRDEVPGLLALADVLVQPGGPNPFNDQRFPSKLPEYLASGRAVVLPRTNVGRLLRDGEECLLLERGDAMEIAAAVERLLGDPALRERIGRGGRAFALRELTWPANVAKLAAFYRELAPALERARSSTAWSGSPATASRVEVGAPPSLAGRASPATLLAFYLPQFHPIPENDAWWGPGFTEWTNVIRAAPQFDGHHQPQLPTDLGFYDLRAPEVMDRQAELARAYGVGGFCFYYYWFDGKRLLERPLEQMLQRGAPDFPFCICWANENWSRRWDGSEHELLMEQRYAPGWDERFIRDVLPYLRDRRAVRVSGHPLLAVYRVDLLPDAQRAAATWRRVCEEEGLGAIHLCAVQSFGIGDPRPHGFDAAIEFPPHTQRELLDPRTRPGVSPRFEGYLESYPAVVRNQLAKPLPPYPLYRGAMPSWDNTARRKNRGHVLVDASPALYRHWVEEMVGQSLDRAGTQEPLVFVNAWNEWAEGTHLEPDDRYGHAWLEATRQGLCEGVAAYHRRAGLRVKAGQVAAALDAELEAAGHEAAELRRPAVVERAEAYLPARRSVAPVGAPAAAPAIVLAATAAAAPVGGRKTSGWFSDAALAEARRRYRDFPVEALSYATVRDYCDGFDHLRPLATHNGDLKDVQRPWILKALMAVLPERARVLEIGAGEPFVGDLLSRLGHEVWIVDPYDGTGNGPQEYERFRGECSDLRFIRSFFGARLEGPPPGGLDAIYSISVLEHVPPPAMLDVYAGLRRFLKPEGHSIHAVDHVHRGAGAPEHLANLRSMVDHLAPPGADLGTLLGRMEGDTETYYLSAESHNRWRGGVPYDEFPMRVCVSVQLFARARELPQR